MTYLGFPRLHFSGRFQADPSTVNNEATNFDLSIADSVVAGAGGWNPEGTAVWRFVDCAVRSVCYRDGTTCDDPNVDPIVGMPVNDADDRVAGKIVDLDPQQQLVSEIWGFEVLLGRPPARNGFRSDFEPTPFCDLWPRFAAGTNDSRFGAAYQSVLTVTDWPSEVDSRLLLELSEGGPPGQLSIKLTVDGLNPVAGSPGFTFGRVVGVIGPQLEGEPRSFVAARRLRRVGRGPLVSAPCRIDGEHALIDLANSLPTTAAGGPLVNVGPLHFTLVPEGREPQLIGQIDYLSPGWYEQRAGICRFDLSPTEREQAATTPLGVVRVRGGEPEVLLRENAAGAYVQADRLVFRLEPSREDPPQSTTFFATTFGSPAGGRAINLSMDNAQVQAQVSVGPPPDPPVGVPTTAVTFPAQVTTDESGHATAALSGSDPGNPRGYIDGQVYGVRYDWDGLSRDEYGAETLNVIAVRVFDPYSSSRPPTWVDDVQPIFSQYARLYPVMRRVLDLSDYESVLSHGAALGHALGLSVADPNSMPVTRDLSAAKRKMLLDWLEDPVYMKIDDVEELKRALQQAIELEHATIPPYLCALFSIKPGSNHHVAKIIRLIVVEEMLHMALACNLLNAIGGSPQIDAPGFVPTYPGPLPGELRPRLTVRLRKASIEQIQDVFMKIEEPEQTVDPVKTHHLTIGWFYRQIEQAFGRLDDAGRLFVGDPARQVRTWRGTGELIDVRDLDTARKAICEIVEQGEGASALDPSSGPGELAHFFRFEEIVRGRSLERTADGYRFTGPPIVFDPDGVWPMADDPDTTALPKGSYARQLSEQFNDTYGRLLRALDRVFNGHPDEFDSAIALMYALEVTGKGLMEVPVAAGAEETAGPAFQYPSAPERARAATPRFARAARKGHPAV